MGRIALVTSDRELARRIQGAVPPDHQAMPHRWRDEFSGFDPVRLVADLAATGPDVICLGTGVPVTTMMRFAAACDRDHPEIAVVLFATPTPEVLEQALRAGVRDVLDPEAKDAEVRDALIRALAAAGHRRVALAAVGADGDRPMARVLTIVSPKGGSGKTMLATNLATALARQAPGQVAIIDLDTHFGDVASALALNPEHTLADVSSSPVPPDATMLKVFLTSHPSGLFALCGPPSPAAGDEVTYQHAGDAVRLLARSFKWVVVDTAAGLDETTLSAVELSTDLVMISSMDVTSVRSLRKEIDALDQAGMTSQRRHFILNRANSRVGLEVADVEAVIGLPVAVSVPSSRLVSVTMNRGTPVVDAEPRSPVARSLNRFAAMLVASSDGVGGNEPKEPKAPREGWRRRRKAQE